MRRTDRQAEAKVGIKPSSIHISDHPVGATRFWSYILQQHRHLRLTDGLKWKNAATVESNKISRSSSDVLIDRGEGSKPQNHLQKFRSEVHKPPTWALEIQGKHQ